MQQSASHQLCWNLGCPVACRNCFWVHFTKALIFLILIDIFTSVCVLTFLHPLNCWHGSPFTQKFLQLSTRKRSHPKLLLGMLIIFVPFFHISHFSGRQHYVRQGAVPQWETDIWISGCWPPSSELGSKTELSRKLSKSLTARPRVRWRLDCWETSSGNSASTQQRMSCR